MNMSEIQRLQHSDYKQRLQTGKRQQQSLQVNQTTVKLTTCVFFLGSDAKPLQGGWTDVCMFIR